MTWNSLLYQSHVETYLKFCSQTMVSKGLGPKSSLIHAVHPGRVRGPHLHTIGEMVCSWFGTIPVVERENGNATLHQLCYILLMSGEWWIYQSISSMPTTQVRGTLQHTIDEYVLARFDLIPLVARENWVDANAEICDNLLVGPKWWIRVACTRGATWPGVQAPSSHHGQGILCFDWANYVGGERNWWCWEGN